MKPSAATNDDDDAKGVGSVGLNGQKPALQVICLGSGGGPSEDNTSGFLVRSVGTEWARGSMLAVDAGSHLAPIARILERDFPAVSQGVELSGWTDERDDVAKDGQDEPPLGVQTPGLSNRFARASLSPPSSGDTVEDTPSPSPVPDPTLLTHGPFAGLSLPNASARANAAHLVRAYISTYLITHPHLDHLSGFAINTAAFHGGTRPKTLAALPSTVEAVKAHIFNDIIWPNLTDEDGGVGFVTFQRLKEGGDPMIGEGEGRGYIDVCDGLGVRAFKVSHGTCTKSPPSHHHRGSRGSISGATVVSSEPQPVQNGSLSMGMSMSLDAPPTFPRQTSLSQQQAQQQQHPYSTPGTPNPGGRPSLSAQFPPPQTLPPPAATQPFDPSQQQSAPGISCVVDSTAFFIRSSAPYAREILIFGDVEPDALSLSPRNHLVWAEAARKVAAGLLGAVFIECSYDDSQQDGLLFGHLCPRWLVAELRVLAGMVGEAREGRRRREEEERAARVGKKRKRSQVHGGANGAGPEGAEGGGSAKRSRSLAGRLHSGDSYMPGASSTAPSTNASTRQNSPEAAAGGDVNASPKTVPKLPVQQTSQPAGLLGSTSAKEEEEEEEKGKEKETQPKGPLAGLRVVVMHIKDTLKDGPHVSKTILRELREHERAAWEGEDGGFAGGGVSGGLGCSFEVAGRGRSYWI